MVSDTLAALPGPETRNAAHPLGADTFFRVITATPDEVRLVLRAVLARFARTISADDAGALELALAEVLNNVVEHAYGDQTGLIVVEVVRHADALACVVSDRGRQMPGGDLPPALDFGALSAGLAEGGFGWPLIRTLTRDLNYLRCGRINVLSFRIALETPRCGQRTRRVSP